MFQLFEHFHHARTDDLALVSKSGQFGAGCCVRIREPRPKGIELARETCVFLCASGMFEAKPRHRLYQQLDLFLKAIDRFDIDRTSYSL